jgi:ferric enterobactin receptor
MNRFTIVLLLFLILIFPSGLKGQGSGEHKVYGRILSYQGNTPLSFAAVVVISTGKGSSTNEDGYFAMEVPHDTSTLLISYVGYKDKKIKLNSIRIQSSLVIKLEKDVKEIEEVTVAMEKERIIRVPDQISTVKISPKLIARLPNLGEVDVLRSFQLLPGVSATNETSAGLYVRGGTPDQNLILFDGMTIYHVDHFYGFFSAFNANTIDDITLIKGGFPAKYGGRISSVMEITGKPADMEQFHGGASISLLSANGFFEVPFPGNKVSLQLAARRSYTDIVRTGLYNKIFDLYNDDTQGGTPGMPGGGGGGGRFSQQQVAQEPKFHFYDLNSKLTIKPDTNNTIALSFYNGKDKLDNSRDITGGFNQGTTGGGSITDLAEWGNIGTSLQWRRDWSQDYTTNLFLSYSNYFSRRDRSTDIQPGETGEVRVGQNLIEDNNVRDFSFRFRNDLYLGTKHHLEFGAEGTWNDIRYLYQVNDTLTPVDRQTEGFQVSAYGQDNYRITDHILVNVGIRGTYYNMTDKFYLEPRLAITYEPVENLRFKGAWGIYNQYIARIVREDVLQGSRDFWLLSDGETIPVGSSTQYIAGVSYEKNNWFFDTEAFYKDLQGLTEYTMRFTGGGFGRGMRSSQETYFFEGSGHVKGMEFLVQKKYGKNTGWIAYTLSEVIHTYPELNYGNPFYALHDQTHEFKAVYTRRIGRWDFSGAFIYGTGKPYTAPESVYELTLLDGTDYQYIHVNDKNSLRLPAYHRLDLSASYSWKGRKTEQSISLSVFNLYNRKNIWYKEFEIEEDVLTVTDVVLLGTTPNLSFRISF